MDHGFKLDTTHDSFLTLGGQQVKTAQCLTDGKLYGKICENAKQDEHENLRRSGARHFSSDVPGFRGWWRALTTAELQESGFNPKPKTPASVLD